jgi:oligosaccharyltransferase complex subunit beta
MRNLLYLLVLALLGLVQAISSAGDRLLVVLEDESEKTSFSQFWRDLEGAPRRCTRCLVWSLTRREIARGFKITFESPKNEKLSLFRLGERSYDHLILTPPKSKGQKPCPFNHMY